ncbi:hypothetical protein N7517_006290 [Penicillium concentricum]|uniref:Uncharacterized protein n=1 Tax=Penicillium concentricum TaxID=293559 RepID=A0A9W9SBT9_9EURO|nr:uncharacterized protein N7517_006290 [Penicillium concentricum]KAJ5374284.1 hypothetical protein N7517_006290 [Penicillium concentricum]
MFCSSFYLELVIVVTRTVLGHPYTFVLPGSYEIVYQILETDATYIHITASKEVEWFSLAEEQKTSNSSSLAASNAIFLSLKEQNHAQAGPKLPNCEIIPGQRSFHNGLVQATMRCNDYPIMDRLETFLWAYEAEGTVFSGPIQVLEGHNFDCFVMTGRDNLRRVVRSTASQSSSSGFADMASLMAKYDRLLKIR